jgi:predicted nucleotidyltransferase
MVRPAVLALVGRFVSEVESRGIPVSRVVLFGSEARGTAGEWSDIDLVVVSSVFDEPNGRDLVDSLWEATVATRGRIEPVACGERRWREDDGSPIVEIARREGIDLDLDAARASATRAA